MHDWGRSGISFGRGVFRKGEFSDIDASSDYKQMFDLHQGLRRLYALASEAVEKGTSDTRRDFLDKRFGQGLEALS